MVMKKKTKRKDNLKEQWFMWVYLGIIAVVFAWFDFNIIGAPFSLLILIMAGIFVRG